MLIAIEMIGGTTNNSTKITKARATTALAQPFPVISSILPSYKRTN